jgi:hypothetical protein
MHGLLLACTLLQIFDEVATLVWLGTWKSISFPGAIESGSVSHLSSVASFQTMPVLDRGRVGEACHGA